MGSSDGGRKAAARTGRSITPPRVCWRYRPGPWDEAQDLLARLYCSHTYREIWALADPERDLPATMPPIDDAARRSAAHGYANSAQVADDMLSGFLWWPHIRQHGLGIERPSMSDGLAMRCDRLTDQTARDFHAPPRSCRSARGPARPAVRSRGGGRRRLRCFMVIGTVVVAASGYV